MPTPPALVLALWKDADPDIPILMRPSPVMRSLSSRQFQISELHRSSRVGYDQKVGGWTIAYFKMEFVT